MTSRRTASSVVSPGSTNPASAEYIPGAKWRWRPSKHRSPSMTSMITTGSTRGKWRAPQTSQMRCQPAVVTRLTEPQFAQKEWRRWQSRHRLPPGQYSERSRSDKVLQRERAKVDAVIVGAGRWVLWRKIEREAEREASAAV